MAKMDEAARKQVNAMIDALDRKELPPELAKPIDTIKFTAPNVDDIRNFQYVAQATYGGLGILEKFAQQQGEGDLAESLDRAHKQLSYSYNPFGNLKRGRDLAPDEDARIRSAAITSHDHIRKSAELFRRAVNEMEELLKKPETDGKIKHYCEKIAGDTHAIEKDLPAVYDELNKEMKEMGVEPKPADASDLPSDPVIHESLFQSGLSKITTNIAKDTDAYLRRAPAALRAAADSIEFYADDVAAILKTAIGRPPPQGSDRRPLPGK